MKNSLQYTAIAARWARNGPAAWGVKLPLRGACGCNRNARASRGAGEIDELIRHYWYISLNTTFTCLCVMHMMDNNGLYISFHNDNHKNYNYRLSLHLTHPGQPAR